jgi:hypothetical protein
MSTATHGIVDYIVGGALMALPPFFSMKTKTKAILESSGALAGAYSMMTDYERGMVKVIPMKGHLALDALSGGMLLGSAMMLDDESPEARTALACVGAFEIAAALLTETKTSKQKRENQQRHQQREQWRSQRSTREHATT